MNNTDYVVDSPSKCYAALAQDLRDMGLKLYVSENGYTIEFSGFRVGGLQYGRSSFDINTLIHQIIQELRDSANRLERKFI